MASAGERWEAGQGKAGAAVGVQGWGAGRVRVGERSGKGGGPAHASTHTTRPSHCPLSRHLRHSCRRAHTQKNYFEAEVVAGIEGDEAGLVGKKAGLLKNAYAAAQRFHQP